MSSLAASSTAEATNNAALEPFDEVLRRAAQLLDGLASRPYHESPKRACVRALYNRVKRAHDELGHPWRNIAETLNDAGVLIGWNTLRLYMLELDREFGVEVPQRRRAPKKPRRGATRSRSEHPPGDEPSLDVPPVPHGQPASPPGKPSEPSHAVPERSTNASGKISLNF